ncbi:CapA family protein, partial [Rhizobium leguminosarum]
HPVEMGRDTSPDVKQTRRTGKGDHHNTEGRPMVAKGEDAVRIIDRYRRLSEPLGTKIEIRSGVGVIEL